MKLSKIKTLINVIKYVYSLRPLYIVTREILLLFIIVLNIYVIKLGGLFLDATFYFINNTPQYTIARFMASDSFHYLSLSLGLWLIAYSFSQIREYINDKMFKTIVANVKSTHIEKIAKLNLEDIELKEFRDKLTLSFHFGPQNIWNAYKTITSIVQNLVSGVTSLVILFQYTGAISFIVAILALPEAVAGYLSRKKIKKYHDKNIEKIKLGDYVEGLTTQINLFPELKVNGTINSLKREYDKASSVFNLNVTELFKHQIIDTTFFSTLGNVSFNIFIAFAIYTAVLKKLSIGTFKVIYDYAQNVYSNFLAIFDSMLNISTQLDYAVNFFDVKEFAGFGDVSHGEVTLAKGTPNLKFINLDFTYPGSNDKVLENVNFEAHPGEKIMIIGDDGSGKSSLVKVLCGLHRVVAGDYEIDQFSIRELARGELKKKLALLFQDFINYNTTLRKNIIMTSDSRNINDSLYGQALKISGVDKLMKKYSISDHQILGKFIAGGKDISPGFWQRLAIARMIYRNRNVYILDEPFTYIDDAEEKRILTELFDFIGKDRTVIYITRDNRHREFFDKIYRLKQGKLIKD